MKRIRSIVPKKKGRKGEDGPPPPAEQKPVNEDDIEQLRSRNHELDAEVNELRVKNWNQDRELHALQEKFVNVQKGLTKIEEERRGLYGSKRATERELRKLKRRMTKQRQLPTLKEGETARPVDLDAPIVEEELNQTKTELQQVKELRDELQKQFTDLKKENIDMADTMQSCFKNMEKMVHVNQEKDKRRKEDNRRTKQKMQEQRRLHIKNVRSMAIEMRKQEEEISHLLAFIEEHIKGQTPMSGEESARVLAMKLYQEKHTKETAALRLEHAHQLRSLREEYDFKLADLATALKEREQEVSSLRVDVSTSMTKMMTLSSEIEKLHLTDVHDREEMVTTNNDPLFAKIEAHEEQLALEMERTASELGLDVQEEKKETQEESNKNNASDDVLPSIMDELSHMIEPVSVDARLVDMEEERSRLQRDLNDARMNNLSLESNLEKERQLVATQTQMITTLSKQLQDLGAEVPPVEPSADEGQLKDQVTTLRQDLKGEASQMQEMMKSQSKYILKLNHQLEDIVKTQTRHLSALNVTMEEPHTPIRPTSTARAKAQMVSPLGSTTKGVDDSNYTTVTTSMTASTVDDPAASPLPRKPEDEFLYEDDEEDIELEEARQRLKELAEKSRSALQDLRELATSDASFLDESDFVNIFISEEESSVSSDDEGDFEEVGPVIKVSKQ